MTIDRPQTIQIKVTAIEAKLAKKAAEAEGLTVSAWLRAFIRSHSKGGK